MNKDNAQNDMENIFVREAAPLDALKSAQLQVLESNLQWQVYLPVFENEFSICAQKPDLRVYYLAFFGEELVSYAGARFYDNKTDENMYDTEATLPTGWYLRGIKVHPDWRRNGLGRKMTLRRLDWLSRRSNKVYVFLDDANKPSLSITKSWVLRSTLAGGPL